VEEFDDDEDPLDSDRKNDIFNFTHSNADLK
jgi:hypothetical protein